MLSSSCSLHSVFQIVLAFQIVKLSFLRADRPFSDFLYLCCTRFPSRSTAFFFFLFFLKCMKLKCVSWDYLLFNINLGRIIGRMRELFGGLTLSARAEHRKLCSSVFFLFFFSNCSLRLIK